MTKQEKLKPADLAFLFSALTLPLLQFILFYVVVNGNSIVMAFQKTTDGVTYSFNGLNTIKQALYLLFTDTEYKIIIKNTFVLYFASQIVVPAIAVLFALGIWKKVPGSKFFSIILFLPSVISSVVFVMIARVATNSLLPAVFNNPKLVELFNVYTTGFTATTVYYCFLSFGAQLILQLGAMGGIDQSIVEYGKIDGVNAWQEFRVIVFPHIWPTLISIFVIGIASIFTNQGLLISFYGAGLSEATIKTFGSQMYISVINNKYSDFPILTAMGLFMTIVVVVVSSVVKRVMERLGPSED